MPKHNHTPGPWSLDTVQTSCGVCHKIGPFPKINNKDSYACIYVDNSQWSIDHELHANAKLISSAPDMLEALEHALKYLDGRTPKLDMVIDAIKKAQGN